MKDSNEYLDDKHLVIFNNQIRFDQTQLGSDSVIRESILTYQSFTTQVFQREEFRVAQTDLVLQDSAINLDQFTEYKD